MTTVSLTLNISCTRTTVHGFIDNKLLEVPVTVIYDHKSSTEDMTQVDMKALLDSGAKGEFIDQNYARSIGIEQKELAEPIKVLNVDGTRNKRGTIIHYVDIDLQIGDRTKFGQ